MRVIVIYAAVGGDPHAPASKLIPSHAGHNTVRHRANPKPPPAILRVHDIRPHMLAVTAVGSGGPPGVFKGILRLPGIHRENLDFLFQRRIDGSHGFCLIRHPDFPRRGGTVSLSILMQAASIDYTDQDKTEKFASRTLEESSLLRFNPDRKSVV